ncbi:hypothetical protein DR864_09190 [Runella rosea]|uniref:Tyr recombinase domain-containing protein n=1 Tax=Runella rosea TaxID=2259595 RepID=A0A344TGX1_9BACT|nr:site-specific integrase [Runella rosea]AXE17892.1 hypothetical protein DR864_09190 [Runella rosea]
MSKVQKSHLTKQVRAAERSKTKSRPNTVSIMFWVRKSEAKAKTVSVIVRLTHNKISRNYSTGIICNRAEFDKETLSIKYNPATTLVLQDLRAKLNATIAEFKLTARPINLKAIWQVANGQMLNSDTPNLESCLKLFFELTKERFKAGECGKHVIQKVAKWNTCIKGFAQVQYGKNAELDDITPADAKRFQLYLKNEHSYSHNVASHIVQHFKRVLNYALENEWINRNPFMNYRKKLEKIKGEILTESEMEEMQSFTIFAPILDHIRQAFLFQCYTGLSYAELLRVSTANILLDEKTGNEYIKINRKKTNVESIVPINHEARRIIDLFKDHPARISKGVLLPIISNQKYNNYLKQLAGVMGMTKRLTSHVARRTAATYYLTKGVPMESVSAMMGHTNTLTTQTHYTVTRPERIINDFKNNDIKLSDAG